MVAITLRSSLVGLLFALAAPHAAAAEWPTRPVRIIMPFDSSSSADTIARALAQRLSDKWGQAVVVENRPGAGTIIGTETIARAAPDGYTLGWATTALAINAALRDGLPYDALADFSGVSLVYQMKAVILVTPDLPVDDVAQLVRWLKGQGGHAMYTSPGAGTTPHLLGELFKLRNGVEMQHVAYKNLAQAKIDVIAGRVPVMFSTLPTALPYIESGRLRLLAVVSDRPVPSHPELPILTGLLPRQARMGWNGVMVPAGTPRAIVRRLNADIVEAVHSPEIVALMARLSVEPTTSTPEAFDALVRAEVGRWMDLVKRAGIAVGSPD
jgi:tripartite-type tricarboxylate transporter receptor subunit TctC